VTVRLVDVGVAQAAGADLDEHSPVDLLTKRIKIIGSQQNGREYLHEALAIAASGKVRVVTEPYRLDEIGKAYERVEKGQVRFRAVVTM
jgi:D-arabinose 1-dehydrogenase-like Zn-dependent alcohol dehydrogenase